ncbi:hypothetical protein IF2G_02805 [Cordyceps javanica]|nr:hypothetical protein IF2G_02805 [Cordyceps javanica]
MLKVNLLGNSRHINAANYDETSIEWRQMCLRPCFGSIMLPETHMLMCEGTRERSRVCLPRPLRRGHKGT